jgi:sulfopyruvate decarboxylase subunit beta
MELVRDEIVVCNLGHPSQELFMIKDRPRNFYMLGSMGLASSIGMGLALSSTEKVIVIEGDGAILMNLGSLATIGVNQPKNYILIIIDNESYGSTGFQETFTARGVELAAIAMACNISNTRVVKEYDEVKEAVQKALTSDNGPFCILVKTERGKPDNLSIIPFDSIYLRDRFMEEIRGKKS